MNSEYLFSEAEKCLMCKKPRCKENCPISTDIHKVIDLYKQGKIQEAGEMLFENNPLSLICSIVCYHREQCYGNCVLNSRNNAVEFFKIEEEISRKYLYGDNFEKVNSINQRVGIIGGGPAGISVALKLSKIGYDVTIFDKNEFLGGVLRYGIPSFRLNRDILNRIEEILIKMGVKIRYNILIGPSISIDKLFSDGYDAIFVGTGVWEPNILNIKGETFGHVNYAINYLKSPHTCRIGKNIIVIGAGNVAIDAARTASRNGSNVTIVYRRGLENMTASEDEILKSKEDGVKFEFYKSPAEITDEGVYFYEVKKSEEDNKFFVDESERVFIKGDSVIIAVSQGPKSNIISTCKELQVNKRGLIICNEFGETTKEGVFAGGDVVSGPDTVVGAVNTCNKVVESIHKYLLSKRER